MVPHLAVVAQWLERLTVAQEAVGSILIIRPILYLRIFRGFGRKPLQLGSETAENKM